MDVYSPLRKTNLISQAFLELLQFQESLNPIGYDQKQKRMTSSVALMYWFNF